MNRIILIVVIVILIIWVISQLYCQCKNQRENFSGSNISLSGNQEVPSNQTASTGQIKVDLTQDKKQLNYEVTSTALSSEITGTHFHLGAPGQNGKVVKTLNLQPININGVPHYQEKGVWKNTDSEPLSQELVDELEKGNIYINIHSQNYPNGEIRGQIV